MYYTRGVQSESDRTWPNCWSGSLDNWTDHYNPVRYVNFISLVLVIVNRIANFVVAKTQRFSKSHRGVLKILFVFVNTSCDVLSIAL